MLIQSLVLCISSRTKTAIGQFDFCPNIVLGAIFVLVISRCHKHFFNIVSVPKRIKKYFDVEKYHNNIFLISWHRENNQERKSWTCLGQFCSTSLIVFSSQLFVILLIIFGCFWRIHLSKSCDESIVWVGILCSAVGYILPSPRLWASSFPQKIASFYHW